ncbi:hypothetical protein GIB67_021738 [Kingdonia uniflora]|uniref:type I protein arginine methyltransferase n=1 Tax=Kingdonia uniflora TaxID=39325 RepID=A0A7J7N3E8_9MAGN|nr:hypothetical protein GIB67_021738 [Kingdonia uniflora]
MAETSLEHKPKRNEFNLISITHLPTSSQSLDLSVAARFSVESGEAQLRFHQSNDVTLVHLRTARLFKLGPIESVCMHESSPTNGNEEKSYTIGIAIRFRTEEDSENFHFAFEQWKNEMEGENLGPKLVNETDLALKSKFDDKTEASSAKMYFHYYGQLLHQQNMLQDYVRTGTYYAAVIENRVDFFDRVVVDVGAGSGILSLFAVQAGAKHVYAVEASEMAEYARRLIAGNPSLGQRITVVKGKVEEVELPEKADILISEPMGPLIGVTFEDLEPPFLWDLLVIDV